ncbi:MAG: 50S ribosomal protein L25, partial [Deltaproteobacteria bacterium]|nr:50S ribosomal protein L25 [Deltaproteobacteria bacterium]
METQDNISLALTPRSVHKKKVRALRREGIIPAVVYGRGFETIMVQVSQKDLEKAYKQTLGAA